MTEKQIETSILEYLNHLPGVAAFKINRTGIWDTKRKLFRTVRNKYSPAGISDIIGIRAGMFFAIEVKTPKEYKALFNRMHKNKMNSHDFNQWEFLIQITASGGKGFYASSVEDVMEMLSSTESTLYPSRKGK